MRSGAISPRYGAWMARRQANNTNPPYLNLIMATNLNLGNTNEYLAVRALA